MWTKYFTSVQIPEARANPRIYSLVAATVHRARCTPMKCRLAAVSTTDEMAGILQESLSGKIRGHLRAL